jgi:hypothetical protein
VLQESGIPITLGGGPGWEFSNNLWSSSPGDNFIGNNSSIGIPHLAKTGITGPGQLTEEFFQNSRLSNPDIGAHEYGQTTTLGDANGDGYVDGIDYAIWNNDTILQDE